jgi:hypothetical protein
MPLYSNNPRYITTIDGGWLVSIPLPENKKNTHKSYRPQTEKILKKAIEWRDKEYYRLYGKPVPMRVFHDRQKDTVTGIPGVRYTIKKVKNKSGKIYEIPVIIAEVHTVPGKNYARPKGSRSKIFSLNKYEWDEAIALASGWLQVKRSELDNIKL